jgi:hypothetical protein
MQIYLYVEKYVHFQGTVRRGWKILKDVLNRSPEHVYATGNAVQEMFTHTCMGTFLPMHDGLQRKPLKFSG